MRLPQILRCLRVPRAEVDSQSRAEMNEDIGHPRTRRPESVQDPVHGNDSSRLNNGSRALLFQKWASPVEYRESVWRSCAISAEPAIASAKGLTLSPDKQENNRDTFILSFCLSWEAESPLIQRRHGKDVIRLQGATQ